MYERTGTVEFNRNVGPPERLDDLIEIAFHQEAQIGRSTGGTGRILSGIDEIVRRLAVTSSPWTPSPRVAPRVSSPSS